MIAISLSLNSLALSEAGNSQLVQNGDGNSVDGWSAARGGEAVTSEGGRIRVTSDDGTTMGVVQTISGLSIGADYQVDIEGFNGPTGSNTLLLRFQSSSNLNGTENLAVGSSGADASFSGIVAATAETMYIGAIVAGAAIGEYAEIDNISIVPA